MVASAENVLKSTENNSKSCENNSKSCEKPLNVRHDMVFSSHLFNRSSNVSSTRPEGAEALSPGQRPGYYSNWQGAL